MKSFSDEDTLSVFNFLRKLNCCYRCILRFLGIHILENEGAYKNPKLYLDEKLNIQLPTDEKKESDESLAKKVKKNSCPVCLDCFELQTIDRFTEAFKLLNLDEYKYSSFFFNISFPKCLAIRAHSILLHLREKFPDVSFCSLYNSGPGQSLEQPHKIFRCITSEIFSKSLNKEYHPKSHLSILLTIGYANDNTEVDNIKQIIKTKTSKKKMPEVSRNNIFELLKDIGDDQFTKHFSVPPDIPDKSVFVEKIDVTADSIYLGGRYLKFKRNVGQTPWVIDGVSVSEHNIQDIIFDAVCNVTRCNKNELTFTASGREDVDVRMLGTGRPFYLKIDNPKERVISKEQLHQIEKLIIRRELAAVIKLQCIYASDLARIKFGEEQKKKVYKALCHTLAPNIQEVVELINKQKDDLKISQLTVLRVLHRRTLMSRDKTIHKMKAVAIPEYGNLFELEMETQAGTYVKEFVHGDFGRTEPSISSIIGYPTDIIALDCVNIDLVWPEDDTEGNLKKDISQEVEIDDSW